MSARRFFNTHFEPIFILKLCKIVFAAVSVKLLITGRSYVVYKFENRNKKSYY